VAKHFAVVGGGWAGCAAAVELVRAGHQVSLFEAGRTLGGRARRVSTGGASLDNGQHIMLGAYTECLRLMRTVGVDLSKAVLSLPLQMRYPPGPAGMDFVAPRMPAPFHLAFALLRARGLAREDKLSLARFSTTARWMGWRLTTDCSVDELLERFDQTPRLVQLMWRPLCLAALNTPTDRASANVFLAVLRDSLGARRAASDMLLPRADLSALFPEAAASWLAAKGGTLRTGAKVTAIAPRADANGKWQVQANGAAVGGNWLSYYDGIALAGSSSATAALLEILPETAQLAQRLASQPQESITTCYLRYPAGTRLAIPFYALVDDPAARRWGQFVFDRGQLDQRQDGLLAVVISAADAAAELPQDELAASLAAQLATDLGMPVLAKPDWHKVITDKRATFACQPGMERPSNATALPGLVIAGDFTAGDYPATLEMAVRSGISAAGLLAKA